MFWKNKKLDSWVKKMDKLVTWLIIWWAVASIFWLSHTKKWKELSHEVKMRFSPTLNTCWKKTIGIIGQILAFFAGIFSKK